MASRHRHGIPSAQAAAAALVAVVTLVACGSEAFLLARPSLAAPTGFSKAVAVEPLKVTAPDSLSLSLKAAASVALLALAATRRGKLSARAPRCTVLCGALPVRAPEIKVFSSPEVFTPSEAIFSSPPEAVLSLDLLDLTATATAMSSETVAGAAQAPTLCTPQLQASASSSRIPGVARFAGRTRQTSASTGRRTSRSARSRSARRAVGRRLSPPPAYEVAPLSFDPSRKDVKLQRPIAASVTYRRHYSSSKHEECSSFPRHEGGGILSVKVPRLLSPIRSQNRWIALQD